jgi:hypothetical protein
MTSYSPVSRAIGVTRPSDTGAWLATIALCITSPVTSSAGSSRRTPLTNRARPIVPAAPATFSTVTAPARCSSSSACRIARAV